MNSVDEISQAERRRILAEDRRSSTYFAQAQASLEDTSGGRYGAVTKNKVTGTDPTIVYPRLPADAPANQMAMSPPEPSLGYSVDAQDAVGEAWEVQKSIDDLRAPSAAASVDEEAPPPSAFGDGRGVGVNKSKRGWRRI
jgi:hypothetical protein